MSRLFDDAASNHIYTATTPITATPFTMACWFYPDDVAVDGTLMWIGDNASASDYWAIYFAGSAAGDFIRADARNSTTASAISTAGASLNTWSHAVAVFTNTTSRTIYINGGNNATNTTSKVPDATIDNITLGRLNDSTPTVYFSGMIAEAAVWDIALGVDSVAMLNAGFSPLFVHPESLRYYAPLVGNYNPEIDIVEGRNGTLSGTTKAVHPRIIYPSSSQIRRFTTAAIAAAIRRYTLPLLGMG